jgi:hypothetical protein
MFSNIKVHHQFQRKSSLSFIGFKTALALNSLDINYRLAHLLAVPRKTVVLVFGTTSGKLTRLRLAERSTHSCFRGLPRTMAVVSAHCTISGINRHGMPAHVPLHYIYNYSCNLIP